MYAAVSPDETAFAMSLFVGAANGQSARSVTPSQLRESRACESLFLALSFGTKIAPEPMRRAALLESSLFRAFCTVWHAYRQDPLRDSLCARVLGFCFLMERSRGEILQLWPASRPSSQAEDELVALHPAVIEAIAEVALEANGMLSESVFLEQLSRVAEHHPDLQQRLPTDRMERGERASKAASWPAGEGETAELMRRKDWGATVCGDISTWPQSKKSAIELTLACKFPMIVLWGPDLIQFYNDGYRDVMGSKHPAGLGQPTRECWPEVWSINEPVYAKVLAGESITFEDQLFPIVRYGYLENAYFTLCYSPLRNESGTISGVLVTVFETTLRARARLHREHETHPHGTSGDFPGKATLQ